MQDKRGCLLLNHDSPTLDVSDAPYNSSQQLLDFLSQYFVETNGSSPELFIGLCFKNAPAPCSGTEAAQNWLSLVDDFFDKAQSLISSGKIKAEFILDGDATPIPAR